MSKIRNKGKSTVVWVLMGLLVLGLGGFGVENFSGGGSTIGEAGDVTITSDEYARALQQEMQGFAAQTGRGLTVAEAQSVGLPQAVLSRLFLTAVMEEQANRLGVSVGDEVVAQQIVGAAAFQDMNGTFDPAIYASILRNEGLSVPAFEQQMRMEEARTIIQNAVITGADAPRTLVDRWVGWILETRDIRWHEVTADELTTPVAAPDDATLEAWHQANADRFTAPEVRKITFAWINPDMIEGKVEVDEQALRDLYEQRIDEFQKPERRMVERLVFPSEEAALEAKARLESGSIGFEALAAERGLNLSDIDLGEVSKAELGNAGDAVFAISDPGVVGPVDSNLGPALYSMNAILEPLDVPFEAAKPELRGEAGLDRARRQIDDLRDSLDDLLAGGATIDELVADTGMEKGQIEWSTELQPEPGSIAGYSAFRTAAAAATQQDFPEPIELDDGGVFVLHLDEIVPPSLIPLGDIRERVTEDWIASETHRQLLALAEERRVAMVALTMAEGMETEAKPVEDATLPEPSTQPNPAPVPGAPHSQLSQSSILPTGAEMPKQEWNEVSALSRDGYIEGVPMALVTGAFDLEDIGDINVVDGDKRVFLVALDQLNKVNPSAEDAAQVRSAVSRQLTDGMQSDLFEYYARAVQARVGMKLNQAAVDAVNSRM